MTKWTKWHGHSLETVPSGLVEIKLRGGLTSRGDASTFNWNYTGEAFDIVAFRHVPPETVQREILETF